MKILNIEIHCMIGLLLVTIHCMIGLLLVTIHHMIGLLLVTRCFSADVIVLSFIMKTHTFQED